MSSPLGVESIVWWPAGGQQKDRDKHDDGEILSGPVDAEPSPVQNTPKAESIMPTPNFRVFSGTRASGPVYDDPSSTTARQAASAPAQREKKPPARSHRDNNENDFQSFQHHGLKCGDAG